MCMPPSTFSATRHMSFYTDISQYLIPCSTCSPFQSPSFPMHPLFPYSTFHFMRSTFHASLSAHHVLFSRHPLPSPAGLLSVRYFPQAMPHFPCHLLCFPSFTVPTPHSAAINHSVSSVPNSSARSPCSPLHSPFHAIRILFSDFSLHVLFPMLDALTVFLLVSSFS